MFVHHIAYRHVAGDVEEFIGSGLTPAAARQHGVYAAKAAVKRRGDSFALARIDACWTAGASPERAAANAKIDTSAYLAALD